MRNILLVQLETKVALAVILIIVIIFLATILKSIDNFNKFIDQLNLQYEPRSEFPTGPMDIGPKNCGVNSNNYQLINN